MRITVRLILLAGGALLLLAAPHSRARAAELLVPPGWAGVWEITTTYQDAATGSLRAVDHSAAAICPHEPFGLALFNDLTHCTGTATDARLTVNCAVQVSAGLCSIAGALQFAVDRSGETLLGAGDGTATFTCIGSPVVSVSEMLQISGVRLGTVSGACAPPSSLVQKFVAQPGALALTSRPFATFTATRAALAGHAFEVTGSFMLDTDSDGIAPLTEALLLQVGTFSTTIPAGAFRVTPQPPTAFTFAGVLDGVTLQVTLTPLPGRSFTFQARGKGAGLSGTGNPVPVALRIGNDSGSTRAPRYWLTGNF